MGSFSIAREDGHLVKIDIVFPRASVRFNGIGDHTQTLADELRLRGHEVRLLQAGSGVPGDLDGTIVDVWPDGQLRNVDLLVGAVVAHEPDVVLLQFEQFSYGKRGYNPEISRLFSRLRKLAVKSRLALYAHESYPDPRSVGRAVMWLYQRAQLRSLARDADITFASCHAVARRASVQGAVVRPLPVHPNIPNVTAQRSEARAELGLHPEDIAVAVFGHVSALRERYINEAFHAIVNRGAQARLVYAGKAAEPMRRLGQLGARDPIILENAPSDVVSRMLTACDLALSPFSDGVSGRRGSFAALMKHGLPTVTNEGHLTDEYLLTASAIGAFALTPSAANEYAETAAALASDQVALARMRELARATFIGAPSVETTAHAIEALT